jgi:hypothetical protein
MASPCHAVIERRAMHGIAPTKPLCERYWAGCPRSRNRWALWLRVQSELFSVGLTRKRVSEPDGTWSAGAPARTGMRYTMLVLVSLDSSTLLLVERAGAPVDYSA